MYYLVNFVNIDNLDGYLRVLVVRSFIRQHSFIADA